MSRYDHTTALLNTGTTMNPLKPEDAMYFDKGTTAYVLAKLQWPGAALTQNPALVLATSHGTPMSSWDVGTRHAAHHDQSGRFMGDFEVLGVISFESGAIYGLVPSRKLRHFVFK